MSTDKDKGETMLKILIPSVAAGNIIGKAGEDINIIQKNAGAKVKMSKVNEFYPGTTERVCLIQGSKEAIYEVTEYIVRKIHERPDPNAKNAAHRHKQIKIIIPNTTASIIIGKSGVSINDIKEQSNAFLQLSQKSKEVRMTERCLTIAGEISANLHALGLILDKIAEDCASHAFTNITYDSIDQPAPNAFPTGSPFAPGGMGNVGGSAFFDVSQSMASNIDMAASFGRSASTSYMYPPTFSALSMGADRMQSRSTSMPSAAPGSGWTAATTAAAVGGFEALRTQLRLGGYSEFAVEEITVAMCILAKYGFLNIANLADLGTMASSSPMQMLSSPNASLHAGAVSPGGPIRAFSHHHQATDIVPVAAATSSGPHLGKTNQSAGVSPSPNISRGPQQQDNMVVTSLRSLDLASANRENLLQKREIQIPESLIGVILGSQGKTVIELQQLTNTIIQASRKGQHLPGTQHRQVTITGTADNVEKAHAIIVDKVNAEEQRRKLRLAQHDDSGISGMALSSPSGYQSQSMVGIHPSAGAGLFQSSSQHDVHHSSRLSSP